MIALAAESPDDLPEKRRKITFRDVESICQLLAKRITEKGSCLLLGIKYETWLKWKTRGKNLSRFENILERVRETKINAVLETIDEAGDKRTYVNRKGETVECSGDWRAKAWLAERVLAPERFADRKQDNNTQPQQVSVNVLVALAGQVYGEQAKQVEARMVKALPEQTQ